MVRLDIALYQSVSIHSGGLTEAAACVAEMGEAYGQGVASFPSGCEMKPDRFSTHSGQIPWLNSASV